MTSAEQLQGCLDDVCGLPDQRSSATSSSYEGFYFGFCTLVAHILLAGITGAIVYKCLVLKLVHTAGHAFYCTIAVSPQKRSLNGQMPDVFPKTFKIFSESELKSDRYIAMHTYIWR